MLTITILILYIASSYCSASQPFCTLDVSVNNSSDDRSFYGRHGHHSNCHRLSNTFWTTPKSDFRHGKDVWKAISDALWAFSPEPANNTECTRHSKLYREHITRHTLWAVQMLESSTLSPSGILSGNSDQLGHFDSCLGVQLKSEGLVGQYCLATLHLSPTPRAYPTYFLEGHRSDPLSLHYPPNLSFWDKLKVTKDPSKKVRGVVRWALCLPASCRVEDIHSTLQRTLQTLRPAGLEIRADLTSRACTSTVDSESQSPSAAYYFIKWLLIMSSVCMVLASAYDMLVYRKHIQKNKPPGVGTQLMLCYSIYENLSALNRPDPSTDLAVIHGMRTYSMFLIILGHRCLFSYGGPFHNPEFLEYRYRRFEDILLLNGTLIVDTFFVLSGFLTCRMLFLELKRKGNFRLIAIYLYRWLRITPIYMLMVVCYAAVLPHLGSGPVWKLKAGLEAERCSNNWWTNLLYINNYINADQMCMFQSWYISCDMHYSLVAPLVVYCLWQSPLAGMFLLGLILTLAALVPFLITYIGRYDGVLRVYMSLLVDPGQVDYYRNVYIKSHNRAVPYVVGMSAAYIYTHLKGTGYKLTVNQVGVGSIVAAIVALTSMMAAWIFYIPGRPYHPLENALYSPLHRLGWASAMSWIIVAAGLTGFGILEPILSMKSLVPLSRLTYSAFLVHGLVQLYSVATLRVPEYMSFPKLFWMWLGDVTASFILALVLHLLVEAPVTSLFKLIQPKRKVIKEG
ncbi:nose resistant to fluoxetine protein 6-like [Homalodisca vitripennis]|uniref:nose resistant to fluoxetine protein 6-like n=1 Tax=Homalodisca vitripennis TaxID=197043 RepID=UPI001EEAE15F|nr:nose resistant to fluoxetine protein 6-like [Homalodisca vitripennis]